MAKKELAVTEIEAEVVETEIVPVEAATADFALPAVAGQFDDGDFDVFTSALFLPRIQLEGSNSDKVKKRKIASGHWSMVTGRESFLDLGEHVDVLVLDHRPKAMDLTDSENVVITYDPNSEDFKRIKRASGKGYLFGLEFLVWVPSANNEMKFATLFMGNATNRVAARNFKPFTKGKTLAERAATLHFEVITNPKFTWEGPTIVRCTSGLPFYPSLDELAEQRESFLNPPKTSVREVVADEVVEAANSTRAR